jgi:hypothetical protein
MFYLFQMEMDTVRQTCKEVFEKYFKDGYKSFKIVVNIRLNQKTSRDDIIKALAETVDSINPLNFVDLKNATYTIVAEILKGVFCVSVLKDFAKYRKFNITEVAAPEPEASPNVEGKEQSQNTENTTAGISATSAPVEASASDMESQECTIPTAALDKEPAEDNEPVVTEIESAAITTPTD